MWVLVIAIFAYDIRDSLYAVRGLAVGLMFEAMCVAQLIARLSTLEWSVNSVAVAVALLALSLLAVANQLLRRRGRQDGRALDHGEGRREAGTLRTVREATRGSAAVSCLRKGTPATALARDADESEARDEGTAEPGCDADAAEPGCDAGVVPLGVEAVEAARDADAAEPDEGVPADIAAYCQGLAAEYGLTPREAEILALMALGRSAKYISEELTVSYNTTRTHVRHIYEKLNIHNKQELIDLVLFGSGVM